MSKEYVKIALAYVGVIVGAGLSSGQDILQYFLSYGKKGIIVMILLVTAYTYFGKSYDFKALDQAARTITPAVSNLWLSVINYFSLCAMTGVSMAFVLGGSIVRIGTAEKGGLLGGSLIGLIITCASLTLFANIDEVKNVDIPMLEIMKEISSAIAFAYTLVIFALIFNTAFSLYYATAKRFGNGEVKRTRIIIVLITALGYVCSFGGFKTLIAYMYPILGYMGILLLVLLAVTWHRKKEEIHEEKYLRRHMIRILLKAYDEGKKLTHKDKKRLHQLSEASAADTTALKQEVKAYTEQLADTVDDVQEFVDEHIPVRKSTGEYIDQMEKHE